MLPSRAFPLVRLTSVPPLSGFPPTDPASRFAASPPPETRQEGSGGDETPGEGGGGGGGGDK